MGQMTGSFNERRFVGGKKSNKCFDMRAACFVPGFAVPNGRATIAVFPYQA